jgi:hypothetical protein
MEGELKVLHWWQITCHFEVDCAFGVRWILTSAGLKAKPRPASTVSPQHQQPLGYLFGMVEIGRALGRAAFGGGDVVRACGCGGGGVGGCRGGGWGARGGFGACGAEVGFAYWSGVGIEEKGSATTTIFPARSLSQSHPAEERRELALRTAARASPSWEDVVIFRSFKRSSCLGSSTVTVLTLVELVRFLRTLQPCLSGLRDY